MVLTGGVRLVAALVLTTMLAGCLVNDDVRQDRAAAAMREGRLAELATSYNLSSDRVLGLADFAEGVDWVRLELVVSDPVERLGVTLEGLPEGDAGLGSLDPRACVQMLYPDVGGWAGFMGEGYTLDTHLGGAPGPDAPSPAAGGPGREWAFVAPEPLVDHSVYIAVDDAAAWLARGHDLQVHVLDGIEVYWRIADAGRADCVLHFDGYRDGDGGGVRALGAGAGAEMYRRWSLPEGGMLSLSFEADLAYRVYVAYADQYAAVEWDSSSSLATGTSVFFDLEVGGTWGVYAPLLAGKQETHLHAFVLER